MFIGTLYYKLYRSIKEGRRGNLYFHFVFLIPLSVFALNIWPDLRPVALLTTVGLMLFAGFGKVFPEK